MENDTRSATEIDTNIGAQIRRRRLEINMSQETLAEKVGVTFQQIQKYEKGVNRVAASRLYCIAHILHLPLAEFFRGAPRASAACSAQRVRRLKDRRP